MTTQEARKYADRDTFAHAPLRLVTEKDLPVLKVLEKEIFTDLAYSMDLLRTFFNLFRGAWYVADQDGDLAGYALVGLNSNKEEGWLLGLAVSNRHRGRGLGNMLMSRALTSMMELNVSDAFLTVRPDNAAARRMYQAFGFVQQGEAVPDYYGNGEPRDVLHRSLTMNPFHGKG